MNALNITGYSSHIFPATEQNSVSYSPIGVVIAQLVLRGRGGAWAGRDRSPFKTAGARCGETLRCCHSSVRVSVTKARNSLCVFICI